MSEGPLALRGGLLRTARAADDLGQRSNLLRDGALAIGGLVGVDDALRGGLVELLGREAQSFVGLLLVAGRDRGVGGANSSLELALDRLVALLRLLVGTDALDLRLDVRHDDVCL